MTPASRPLRRLSDPSVGEITSCVSTRNDTGSAPYFSWLARFCAVACVKLPVICACPPVIASLVAGADTTRLSRTMAKRLRVGSVFFRAASRLVTLPNLDAPSPEKERFTCQAVPVKPWLLVSSPAVAPLTSVPTSSAGPRMYFSLPSSEQVMNGLFGSWPAMRSFCRTSGVEQSVCSNCCCSCGVTQLGALASVGLADEEAEGDGDAAPVEAGPDVPVLASGEAVAVGVGVASSASGMFMPLLDFDGDAFAVELAFGDGLVLGLFVGLLDEPDDEGVGVAVALGAGAAVCSAARTARNCS